MAPKISLSKLKSLPPEERVAILKKFEEQKKKDIEKAENLLKNSQVEIEKRKEKDNEFEEKGKELLEKKVRPEKSEELEDIVEESQKTAEPGRGPVYGGFEEIRKLYEISKPEIYESVRELRNRAAQGRLSEEDENRINFYERQVSDAAANSQYMNDRKAKENLMRIKTAMEQIEEYKNKPMW